MNAQIDSGLTDERVAEYARLIGELTIHRDCGSLAREIQGRRAVEARVRALPRKSESLMTGSLAQYAAGWNEGLAAVLRVLDGGS